MRKHGFVSLFRLTSLFLAVTMAFGSVPALAAGDPTSPNGNFYAYVPCTPNSPAVTYAFATPRTGVVDLSFDVTPLADIVDGHIAFNTADWVMGFSVDRKIDIVLKTDGAFGAVNNSSTKAVNVIPYAKGKTYHFALTVDITSKVYSVKVDGVDLAVNYAFRNKIPTTINNIGVMGVVALSGSFKVTNISEKLIGLVDNDTVGINELNNPAPVKGSFVYRVGPTHKFKKIQDVVSMLKPGDKVLVDGNATYPAAIYIDSTLAGTKEKPIVIQGVTIHGKKPLIKTLNATNMIQFAANNYIFDNFEVAGNLAEVMKKNSVAKYTDLAALNSSALDGQTVFRAVYHNCDNLTVSNCTIHDARMGILTSDTGSGSITVSYCNIYHNGVRGGEHNLYLSVDEALYPKSVARVQFSYIHDSNVGNGLKTRARRNEVYYNWFQDNHYQSLELIGPDPGFDYYYTDSGDIPSFLTVDALRAEQLAADPNIPRDKLYGEFSQREDSDVVGNMIIQSQNDLCRVGGDGTSDMSDYIYDSNGDQVYDADGYATYNKLGPAYGKTYGRYRFVNNTFISTSTDNSRAIRVEFAVESVEMYNNVFYKPNGSALYITDVDTEPRSLNQVIWASGKRQIAGSNNWVQTNALNVPAEWKKTLTGKDPGYAPTRTPGKVYTLKANSPLRGSGVSLSKTVAVWPSWTNDKLLDFFKIDGVNPDTGNPGVFAFVTDPATYQGETVTVSSIDNAFPNPLMAVKYMPVNPVTMRAAPRPQECRIDIGAFAFPAK